MDDWMGQAPCYSSNSNIKKVVISDSVTSIGKQAFFETITDGIIAKELGDQLCFRAYYLSSDGTCSYSKYITNYSPKTYCYNQIKNNPNDEASIELMASILNYGAAAQKYFKYRTDDLMNSDLPQELQ